MKPVKKTSEQLRDALMGLKHIGGDYAIWIENLAVVLAAAIPVAMFLEDEGIHFDLSRFLTLQEVEKFAFASKSGGLFGAVCEPLRHALSTLPYFDPNMIGQQSENAVMNFSYLAMQTNNIIRSVEREREK